VETQSVDSGNEDYQGSYFEADPFTAWANILEAEQWAFARKRNVLEERFLTDLHKRMFGRVLGRQIQAHRTQCRRRSLSHRHRPAPGCARPAAL
jgi:hypothetical protein